MGRYLDIANRFMRELEAKRAAASVPSAHAADRDPPTAYLVAPEMRDWPDERPELWAERAAILEVEAGLPREVAEQTARDLCDPTLARRPAPAGPHESLEVGAMCLHCREEGVLAHLYVRREGRLWCDRCLRRGG